MAASVFHVVIVLPTVKWASMYAGTPSEDKISLDLHVWVAASVRPYVQGVYSGLKMDWRKEG